MNGMLLLVAATVCNCGVVPERENDFVWENDKFGMRAYGPGEFHKWSGFDVFNKHSGASVLEMLRGGDWKINWHNEPCRGVLDNYTMGASRGVGGIAVYADGEWKTYTDWEESKILRADDEACEFELVYPACSAAGKMICHITLKRGDNFFRNDVRFEHPFERGFTCLVGPGLDLEPKRNHGGSVVENGNLGYVSLFEDPQGVNGSTMAAIIAAPGQSFKLMTDHMNCRVLAFSSWQFSYYAGASWSVSGEFKTADAWHRHVRAFRDQLRNEHFRARAAEIAPLLSEQPTLPCPPASDRTAWNAVAAREESKAYLASAERLADAPMPKLTEELYLEFSKNGNRTRYQAPYYERLERLNHFTIAECLEGEGRFVPEVERYLKAMLSERVWTLPAHDRSLNHWKGKQDNVDLFSSERAWAIALTVRLLEDRLNPELVAEAKNQVRDRVIRPYLVCAKDGKEHGEGFWWIYNEYNWNRVCHAGCVSAALLVCDSREERAEAIAFAEESIGIYLRGFGDSGYCSEGMGYWNYGFGNHLLLALNVRAATGGKVNFLADAANARAAAFAVNDQLDATGTSPTFADGGGDPFGCLLDLCYREWPKAFASAYANRSLMEFGGTSSWPAAAMLAVRAFQPAISVSDPVKLPLRSVFDEAGVFLLRSGDDAFAVAVKGRNIGESHFHADAGSYIIDLGGKIIAGDVGGEVYTSRTFSPQRFVSPVLNSYGHPVPVVAGALQATDERRECARIVKTEFTEAKDRVVIDLTGVYPEAIGLRHLERTFTFDRQAKTFTVHDWVKFDRPSAFESPLVTKSPDAIQGRVKVDAKGGEWELKEDEVENPGLPTVRRTAVKFLKPVKEASVTVTYDLH